MGDWVEVLDEGEIRRTLDQKGELDGMPFMPEMFAFCGRRFRVYKSAHKTCDTVHPVRSRRVEDAVHLETRCSGEAHGGCQATCLIFWKTAWLKPLGDANDTDDRSRAEPSRPGGCPSAHCDESAIWRSTVLGDGDATGGVRYSCQATRLPFATTNLDWWDLRQYVEDYRTGNVGIWRMVCGFVYAGYFNLSQAGIGIGPFMRWFYDRAHVLWGGPGFPRRTGRIPRGAPTPASSLALQAGQLVRVKSHGEILSTLDTNGRNRGLLWDAELVPYCGGTYRVLKRVERIIDERSGEMLEMKTPCIILDSVVCQARYSQCRLFCPRSIYSYWREVWLERVEGGMAGPGD